MQTWRWVIRGTLLGLSPLIPLVLSIAARLADLPRLAEAAYWPALLAPVLMPGPLLILAAFAGASVQGRGSRKPLLLALAVLVAGILTCSGAWLICLVYFAYTQVGIA